ncbi:MAG: LLM class F420-dependent oxidoreductase [Immundisolibacterales bacterium]|nr:LLM class F420-dependent oxidoreductase [Immundisolibacterales bacterium]
MKIGIYIFATDYTIRIDELARAAEARAFASLSIPEHPHIPASRRSAWPGGADLPREYWHTLDPFVALGVAAAATSTIRLGTGICLLTERDPIVNAKEAATLDLLSGGRFELAIGAGWNAEEMENHGTAFATRFRVMSERARAMKVIWAEEEPEFHGEFVDFDPIWSWPKPIQNPGPPILVGGETDHTLRRVVDWADGWFPRGRGDFDPAEGMARLARIADEAGRSMDNINVSLFGAVPNRDALGRAEDAGMTRAILALPSNDRDDVMRRLDRHAELL